MSRKLNVTELENRIAPTVGLYSFLSGLAQQDSNFGALFNRLVGSDGKVDVGAAADTWNSQGGSQIRPTTSNFTLDDSRVINDRTASRIMSMLGLR